MLSLSGFHRIFQYEHSCLEIGLAGKALTRCATIGLFLPSSFPQRQSYLPGFILLLISSTSEMFSVIVKGRNGNVWPDLSITKKVIYHMLRSFSICHHLRLHCLKHTSIYYGINQFSLRTAEAVDSGIYICVFFSLYCCCSFPVTSIIFSTITMIEYN